jgi:signal transduction histidine kinase
LIKTIEDLKATRDKLLEKQSVETIAKFAVSVNHEINNPLCSISLNIEILKKMFYDENNEILCKIFATIEKNIEKITDITAKIQNLKRISTKEYLPGIDMIDLNED